MIVQQTETFTKWMSKLKDQRARERVIARINMIRNTGNLGDYKFIGDKVSELRIHYGVGYRVYYTQNGETIILLLVGGDKSSQQRDIDKAKQLAAEN